jgi:hypothetical protein
MPSRLIDLAAVRAAPRPTPAQQHEFIEHVCYAHSWYKHVPPDGADFVVFLSEGTRYGRSVSVEAYRKLCGALDYAWRFEGDTAWKTDSGDAEIAPQVLEVGRVRLHPWCSNDAAAVEVLRALHAGKVPELAGLFDAEARAAAMWTELPDELREDASRYDADFPASVDDRVKKYVTARHDADVQYRVLRAGEVAELGRAIAAVLAL